MRSTKKNAEPAGNGTPNGLPIKNTSTASILGQIKIIDDYLPTDKLLKSSSSSSDLDDSLFETDTFTASKLDFEMMQQTSTPLKNRRTDDYIKISGNLSRSFHDIYKMKKAHTSPDKQPGLYFFKQNKYEKADQYMYELEAAVCSFYHFLAPEFAPTARAVYDETNKYVGIAVKNLPGFKSTLDDPLKEDDLEIEALRFCTIQELEDLDERAKYEELDLDHTPDSQVIHILIKRELGSSATQRVNITAKDLRNFRIVKGLAIGLTISYALEEDDNHTGNMSKDGKRIDFDMSTWPINFLFKKTGPVDWAFRDPSGRFNVTARDIDQFPNLQDALPFYWPTIPVRVLPETFISIASQFFQVSRNAFHSSDNLIYQKLAKHPVFIHYKYATFLKLALTNKDHYKNISNLHIRQELTYQSSSILDMLASHMGTRLNLITKELITVPAFKEFVEKHGDTTIKNIVEDFAVYNIKYLNKMTCQPLYQKQLVDLTQLINDYANLCAELSIAKNQDGIKQDPDIRVLLEQNHHHLAAKLA